MPIHTVSLSTFPLQSFRTPANWPFPDSNPDQNHNKLFCGDQQNHSKVYMERQKTQNYQHIIDRTKLEFKSYCKAAIIFDKRTNRSMKWKKRPQTDPQH
jgi:hypothetical protein